MSRWEYMRRLEELLSDIPPGEREEALQYYNDYINDGGKENEEEVLASLGSPEQVAVTVKEGLEGAAGEFTEKGFQGTANTHANDITKYQKPEPEAPPPETNSTPPKKGLSGGVIVLLVILCIFASPFLIGMASGLFGVVVSVFVVIFSLIIGIGVTSIALLAAAIILAVIGTGQVFYNPLIGLAFLAAAFILAGVGILCLLLTVLVAGKVLPAIVRGIGYLLGKLFNRKGENK